MPRLIIVDIGGRQALRPGIQPFKTKSQRALSAGQTLRQTRHTESSWKARLSLTHSLLPTNLKKGLAKLRNLLCQKNAARGL